MPDTNPQAERRERYAVAIHDAMEPDLSLVDQEPGTQALFARAAEAAVTMADTEQAELRDRIRRVLCDRDGQGALWGTDMLEPDEYGADADAVLAVLPATTDRAAGVADAIRTFPFDNFGMDDVSFALEDDPEAQEWVPALADAVLATLPATTAQAVELRDYWHAEAMSATTRIIELEAQLEELRRMAGEAQQPETQCARCDHGKGAHNVSGCTECPGGWRADHRFTPAAVSQPDGEA